MLQVTIENTRNRKPTESDYKASINNALTQRRKDRVYKLTNETTSDNITFTFNRNKTRLDRETVDLKVMNVNIFQEQSPVERLSRIETLNKGLRVIYSRDVKPLLNDVFEGYEGVYNSKGEYLKFYRTLTGLTLDDIAHLLDISLSTYKFYESNRNKMSYVMLRKFMKVIESNGVTIQPEFLIHYHLTEGVIDVNLLSRQQRDAIILIATTPEYINHPTGDRVEYLSN